MKYFALIMCFAYAVLGCLFLFTDILHWQITRFRVPLGLLLFGYGILRTFMWRRKYMQSQEEE